MWTLWCIGVTVVIAMSRAGMVALAVGVLGAFVLRRSTRRLPFVGAAALFLIVLALVDPKIPVGRGITVSVGQLTANAVSIAMDDTDLGTGQNLQGSKEFRLAWWQTIVDYTVHGRYFWDGKGFGVNLATDDGFQISTTESLRAPHNTHMTVLARMGVPGFTLWALVQLGFAFALARAFVRARREHMRFWQHVTGWILLVWTAMMINTSFDPYLEGPQGAIPFWALFGLGLAALRLREQESRDAAANRAP